MISIRRCYLLLNDWGFLFMEGWIKLHRKIIDSGYFTDSYAVHLWVYLLIEATHKKRKTIFNGKIVELKEGQLITGRKKISQQTGISEQIIRKWLELFEINQQITIEKTNAGSCISIINYKYYQEVNQLPNQPLTNEQPTTNQRPATIQELKNDNNERIKEKGLVNKFTPPQLFEVVEYFQLNESTKDDAEKFHDHFTSNGWLVSGKAKMKDWKASSRNWIKNSKKWNQNNGTKPSNKQATIEDYERKYSVLFTKNQGNP